MSIRKVIWDIVGIGVVLGSLIALQPVILRPFYTPVEVSNGMETATLRKGSEDIQIFKIKNNQAYVSIDQSEKVWVTKGEKLSLQKTLQDPQDTGSVQIESITKDAINAKINHIVHNYWKRDEEIYMMVFEFNASLMAMMFVYVLSKQLRKDIKNEKIKKENPYKMQHDFFTVWKKIQEINSPEKQAIQEKFIYFYELYQNTAPSTKQQVSGEKTKTLQEFEEIVNQTKEKKINKELERFRNVTGQLHKKYGV